MMDDEGEGLPSDEDIEGSPGPNDRRVRTPTLTESVEAPPRSPRLTTGCASIDNLLGGGPERGALTELFGEAGSGKTNLCLQLSREAALEGGKVAYIDTEGVSVERLSQICGDRFDELSKSILFYQAYGMEEQEGAVDKATKLCESNPDMGLLVLDSSTIFYRVSFGQDHEARARHSFAVQLTRLLNTARKMKIPVVLTTQVYYDSKREQVCPIGGHLLDHQAKAILRLEKMGTGVRRATLCKHR
jgi:DNA repair protein RadB